MPSDIMVIPEEPVYSSKKKFGVTKYGNYMKETQTSSLKKEGTPNFKN